MDVDERGIPINYGDAPLAPECPPKPCELCPSGSPVNGMDNWEWCQHFKTCAATIDWERIYSHDL